ncbi:MAG: single-stranded DNA-binding protein [Ignavibacteriaceae bacterium]
MAFSLNKIMLIGNLGRDAETRFTNNNVSVTTFSLATTHSHKNKEGNWSNETTWHNIVAFNLSDFYKENLKKGKKFYIEGRLSKREYTDKDGNKRQAVEVVCDTLIPLEGTADSGSGSENTSDESSPLADVDTDDNSDLPF